MKPLTITSVLLLTWAISHAQLSDDFSNSLLNDQWNGDVSDFVISDDKMLQLQSPEPGTSFIHANIGAIHASYWSFDLRLDFSPSSSNFTRIYLSLSDTVLESASGYFLQLGSNGDQDKIQLYELNLGIEKMIGEGITPLGVNPSLQIQANLEDGLLTITSVLGNTPTIEMKTASPGSDGKGNYFGILCQYTDSRRDKFFFDEIEVSEVPKQDDVAPEILQVEIVSSKQIILYFSEAIDKTSSENLSNYEIRPTIGSPRQASLLADPTMIQLDLDHSLVSGQVYILESRNIADLVGNLHFSEIELQYLPEIDVGLYVLVLSEIFDDPTRTMGLPEAEYLEVFCRKDGINTLGMQLSVGASSAKLPAKILMTDDILLIHDMSDSSLFTAYENTIGIHGLPNLTNTGNDIVLRAMDGKIIHQVRYNDSWHTNDKKDGGYALELINPNDGCALRENWTSSMDLSGGTPGYLNSVHDDSAYTIPKVVNLYPIDQNTLELQLNKSHTSIISTDEVALGPGISTKNIEVIGFNRNEIIIDVEPTLAQGIQYNMVLTGWKDCVEQSYTNSPINFLIPETIAPADLIINEVLFDPVVGGHDFIEIYNVSEKALSLQDILVTNTTNSKTTSFEERYLILPATYLVLTEDARDLISRYKVPQPSWVVESDLPPLNNDAGNITLLTASSGRTVIIDEFDYNLGLHNTLLKETEGVSLERLYPLSATQSTGNWHSAAESAGYATPTGVNSQSRENSSMSDQWTIAPSVFSPDGDGYEDYVLISYKNLDPGNYLHMKIYDSAGRLIRYFANNLSLQTEGEFKWDGSTEAGRKASVGIYTIFIQLFDSNGIVSEIKETCVVAAPLK